MIEMYTVRTSEIDEIEEAVSEIKKQIDFSALKKNSGGLIICHVDFIETGVAEALCKELPFDVIGMTTMASADMEIQSLYDLTLTIFTSDEVTFHAGMTNGINRDNYESEIADLYNNIRKRSGDDPAMIFTFLPFVRDVAGYEIVCSMDKACNGIPLWGAVTNSIDFNYETIQTLCNGRNLPTGIAMMFVTGPVEPEFIVSSIPERNISNSRAIVTKSNKAILYEINDMPVLEYLASAGLVITKENITAMPMMVYYDKSIEPVALGFYTLYDDGSVMTGGEMPVGTSLAVGCIDENGIFESADEAIKQIQLYEDRKATLLLPCLTRYLMLSPNQEREMKYIQKKLSDKSKPFIMGYAGGEVCPMRGSDGKYYNRFHNYSFCACILK